MHAHVKGESDHNSNSKGYYQCKVKLCIPEKTVNILSTSAVYLSSLALTTRHNVMSLLIGLVKDIGRSTEIRLLSSLCSLFSDRVRFLQLARSFPNPNITVQDLWKFILVVSKKVHVILSVSTSNVKSTSKNWFLEPIIHNNIMQYAVHESYNAKFSIIMLSLLTRALIRVQNI